MRSLRYLMKRPICSWSKPKCWDQLFRLLKGRVLSRIPYKTEGGLRPRPSTITLILLGLCPIHCGSVFFAFGLCLHLIDIAIFHKLSIDDTSNDDALVNQAYRLECLFNTVAIDNCCIMYYFVHLIFFILVHFNIRFNEKQF